jgi:uncharacterized LabA/DUF88 family protein
MASDDLRRAADNFIDLADLSTLIGRPARERAGAEERAPEHAYDVDR